MKKTPKKIQGTILGLDLGKKTTGLARINTIARLAEALDPITMSDHFMEQLQRSIDEHDALVLVVGVPRSLDGRDTEQTDWTRTQIKDIRAHITIPVVEIDEAGTTKAAERIATEAQSTDSVAATLLLDDFLAEVSRGKYEGIYEL